MFDQMTQYPTQETADWADNVQRGDIVLFRFPIRMGDDEAPKIRPCLVLEVEEHGGRKRLTLAYGTSAATPANRGYEIAVTHVDDCHAAGLTRATRFVGARLVNVSPDHLGFDVGGTLPPVIAGRMMIADAPKFVPPRLDQLLNTAGLERETSVLDFDALALRAFEGDALDALYASLTRRRASHRAGPDSRRLARAWQRGLAAEDCAPAAA